MMTKDLTLSLAASIKSRWIDVSDALDVSVQLDCGDVASPVGAFTFEFSNDRVCENEIFTDVDPASTTAVKVDCTASVTVRGTALSASGYDGVGSKASFVQFGAGLPRYFRVVYTRTSGGAGDTLHIRTVTR